MIGPIMIGPSSSHTAGVVRIGNVARMLLAQQPDTAEITFYNSFARTYEGHGSDRAIVAGLLGFKTDDTRIKTAFDEAQSTGLEFSFRSIGNASTMHPNTVKINLKAGDKSVSVVGESRGGGVIKITEVNGFASSLSANTYTAIIRADDRRGAIAFIASLLANEECNIATMSVNRKGKNHEACHFIEMDSPIVSSTLDYIKSLSWVKEVTFIPGSDF